MKYDLRIILLIGSLFIIGTLIYQVEFAGPRLAKLTEPESERGFSQEGLVELELEGKSYQLLVADTDQEREKGLMFVREKEGFDGMLFLFPKKEVQTFWNKNTLVDLDLYWLEDDKVVGKSFLPSIERSQKIVTVSSPAPVDRVIEIIR